jgi:hypothetical protein
MPGMRVTVDAAMRARDVSRPHPEHEAATAEQCATSAVPSTGVASPTRASRADEARGGPAHSAPARSTPARSAPISDTPNRRTVHAQTGHAETGHTRTGHAGTGPDDRPGGGPRPLVRHRARRRLTPLDPAVPRKAPPRTHRRRNSSDMRSTRTEARRRRATEERRDGASAAAARGNRWRRGPSGRGRRAIQSTHPTVACARSQHPERAAVSTARKPRIHDHRASYSPGKRRFGSAPPAGLKMQVQRSATACGTPRARPAGWLITILSPT